MDPENERLHWQRVLELLQEAKQRGKGRGGAAGDCSAAAAQEGGAQMVGSEGGERLSNGGAEGGGPQAAVASSSGPLLVRARDLSPLLWSLARVKREAPLWWIRLYEAVLMIRLNVLSVQVLISVESQGLRCSHSGHCCDVFVPSGIILTLGQLPPKCWL